MPYTYDGAYQLVSVTFLHRQVVSYEYDNGNHARILQNEPLIPIIPTDSTDLTYNLIKNRLLSAGSVNFTYDDEGQLATKSSDTYNFDYEHRLKTVIANTMTLSS